MVTLYIQLDDVATEDLVLGAEDRGLSPAEYAATVIKNAQFFMEYWGALGGKDVAGFFKKVPNEMTRRGL